MEFSPYLAAYMARETAQTLKILGHPDRVAILVQLLRNGPLTTTQLARGVALPQTYVSAHLTKLTERGVIHRPGNQHTPHELVLPAALVSALWGASQMAGLRYNDTEAIQLARELLKLQMTTRAGRQARQH